MDSRRIEIRLENARASVEKTGKTLDRHRQGLKKLTEKLDGTGVDYSDLDAAKKKAASSGNRQVYWLLCDYEDKLDAVRANETKLSHLNEKLKEYLQLYRTESARQDVPRVPVLEAFLAHWKYEAADWYRDRVTAMRNFEIERKHTCDQIRAKYAPHEFKFRREIAQKEKTLGVDYDSYMENLKRQFGQDVRKLSLEGRPGEKPFEDALEKMLDDEVREKRLDLYYRCSAAVGVITDASNLRVGVNGSLNGLIVGENGKAVVESIRAGGYNIQCAHFRVLVKPIRAKESLTNQIRHAQDVVKSSPKEIVGEKDTKDLAL